MQGGTSDDWKLKTLLATAMKSGACACRTREAMLSEARVRFHPIGSDQVLEQIPTDLVLSATVPTANRPYANRHSCAVFLHTPTPLPHTCTLSETKNKLQGSLCSFFALFLPEHRAFSCQLLDLAQERAGHNHCLQLCRHPPRANPSPLSGPACVGASSPGGGQSSSPASGTAGCSTSSGDTRTRARACPAPSRSNTADHA